MIAIDTLLEQTIAELQRFITVIGLERSTLISGDINGLPEIAEEKSALATRLSRLETQRDAALGAAGFGVGKSGVDAWLAANPVNSISAKKASWKKCMDLAAEANRENEINGKLIGASLQQNKKALATLLGESADTTIYGADGQPKTSSGRRPLGSA